MSNPLLQMMMGAGVAASTSGWENWDETSEDGCATDDIFCCMFENTNASGDETGQGGGLAGANLVLSQSGSVAGATGTPPCRVFDGTNDEFDMTTTAIDALIANANGTWTIIIKVADLGLVNYQTFFKFDDRTGNNTENLYALNTTTDTCRFDCKENGTEESEETTDALQSSTPYWVAMWADGTKIRAGFATSKPDKWSDFDNNKREDWTTVTGDFSGNTFSGDKKIGKGYGGAYLGAKVYYIVLAKICLIDNSS